jgi:hypothetical protein
MRRAERHRAERRALARRRQARQRVPKVGDGEVDRLRRRAPAEGRRPVARFLRLAYIVVEAVRGRRRRDRAESKEGRNSDV